MALVLERIDHLNYVGVINLLHDVDLNLKRCLILRSHLPLGKDFDGKVLSGSTELALPDGGERTFADSSLNFVSIFDVAIT